MPKWFKLNDNRFQVHLEALKNPCGDLWRYIQSHGEQNFDYVDMANKNQKIEVTLAQYRDNGYGTYGHAYITLLGTLKQNGLVIFTRYSMEQPNSYCLKDYDNETRWNFMQWAIDLLKESEHINKIPTAIIHVNATETITITKPIINRIRRELTKGKRVFHLVCHFLECCQTEFVFLKPQDTRIKTEILLTKEENCTLAQTSPSECTICDFIFSNIKKESETIYTINKAWLDKENLTEHLKQILGTLNERIIVTMPCARHPSTSAHVTHEIGKLGEYEITKGMLQK